MKKAFTEFLDPNIQYSMYFMVRKYKYNFTPNFNIFPKGLLITKQDILNDVNKFVFKLRQGVKIILKLDKMNFGHTAYDVRRFIVIFIPVRKISPFIPEEYVDFSTNENNEENNMNNFINWTYNDFINYHRNIISICDINITLINNILLDGLIRKYINPKFFKNIPFSTLYELNHKIMKRSNRKTGSSLGDSGSLKPSIKYTKIVPFIHKRKFHTTIRHYTVNIYSEIKHFLDKNPLNHDTQLKIEKLLLNHGLNIINDKDDQIHGIYAGLYSKKATKFLIKFKPDIIRKIKSFLKFKNLYLNDPSPKSVYKLYLVDIIENVGIPFILTILLGRFIKILSNSKFNYMAERNLVLDIALDLSNDLLREYFKLIYQTKLTEEGIVNNSQEYTFSNWKDENKSFVNNLNDSKVKVYIGVLLLEWLEDCNLITKTLVKLDSLKYNIYSSPQNLVEEWENNIKSDEILLPSEKTESIFSLNITSLISPVRLPCIVTPNPYLILPDNKIKLGGYLLNDTEYADPLILPNPSLDKQSKILNNNIIYKVINNINSIPYKINKELLNIIKEKPYFYENSLLNNHPLEKKTKLNKNEKVILQKHISKVELQKHILNIADLFSNIPNLYFVNRIDNRGRVYCITEYLNYQGNELAKALLLFSIPNKISRIGCDISIAYFKAYGANCFGGKIKRESLNNKAKWVDTNIEMILNYKDGSLIQKADNKFLFTAFCIEYKKWWDFCYNSTETYFHSHLPIQLDASCNGFQHLVLLSGDNNLSTQLNLTSTDYSKKPYDFYSYILEIFKDHLKTLLLSSDISEEDKNSYKRIKNFCIERSLIKKMIMTIPYNATSRTMVENITSLLIKKKEKNGDVETLWYTHPEETNKPSNKLCYKDLFLLVKNMKEILDSKAPKITKLKDYLEKIAYICTKLELHIPWILPSGLEVKQSYLKEKSVDIKPFTYSYSIIRLSVFTRQLDLVKQSRAFMPNLIHSLDALSLMMLLDQYFNNSELDVKNIYTIHDCFAMGMGHIEYIIDKLRKVYISIYSDDRYLEVLDKCILRNIKYHYGIENVNLDKTTNTLSITQDNRILKFIYPNVNEVLGKDFPIIAPDSKYIII
jgi:hypothetical protein